jgi:hypothetical protein
MNAFLSNVDKKSRNVLSDLSKRAVGEGQKTLHDLSKHAIHQGKEKLHDLSNSAFANLKDVVGRMKKSKIDELVDILQQIYERYTSNMIGRDITPTIIVNNDIFNIKTNIFSEILNDNKQNDILSKYKNNYIYDTYFKEKILKYIKKEYYKEFENKIISNEIYRFIFLFLFDLTYIYYTFFSNNQTYTINSNEIDFFNILNSYNVIYHLYSTYLLKQSLIESQKTDLLFQIINISKHIGDTIKSIKSQIDKQELNKRFSEIIGIPNIIIYDDLIQTIISRYDTILPKNSVDNNIKYGIFININGIVREIKLSKNDIDQLKILDDDYKKLLVEERKVDATGVAGGSKNLRHSIDLIIQLFKKQRPSLNIKPDLLYNCILSSSNKNNKKPLRKYNNQRTKR